MHVFELKSRSVGTRLEAALRYGEASDDMKITQGMSASAIRHGLVKIGNRSRFHAQKRGRSQHHLGHAVNLQ